MTTFVCPIVEGHGEVSALPALLHRIAGALGQPLLVNRPIRVKSGSFLHDEGDFGKFVTLAAAKAAMRGGLVLILLDCDDACPAQLGPELRERASAIRGDVPVLVALAKREFEAWFLASARSLRGIKGLPHDLEPPEAPESIRDAKAWLSRRMSSPYDPVVDQVDLVRAFDLVQARACPSFDRLVRRLASAFAGGLD